MYAILSAVVVAASGAGEAAGALFAPPLYPRLFIRSALPALYSLHDSTRLVLRGGAPGPALAQQVRKRKKKQDGAMPPAERPSKAEDNPRWDDEPHGSRCVESKRLHAAPRSVIEPLGTALGVSDSVDEPGDSDMVEGSDDIERFVTEGSLHAFHQKLGCRGEGPNDLDSAVDSRGFYRDVASEVDSEYQRRAQNGASESSRDGMLEEFSASSWDRLNRGRKKPLDDDSDDSAQEQPDFSEETEAMTGPLDVTMEENLANRRVEDSAHLAGNCEIGSWASLGQASRPDDVSMDTSISGLLDIPPYSHQSRHPPTPPLWCVCVCVCVCRVCPHLE